MQKKGLDIFLSIFQILIPVRLVSFLVWATVDLFNQRIEDINMTCNNGDVCVEGYGLTFVAFLIIGLVYNGFILFLGGVGLIIAILYKTSLTRKKNIITFTNKFLKPKMIMKLNRILSLAALAVIGLLFVACSGTRISGENYKLKDGMIVFDEPERAPAGLFYSYC